MKVEKRIPGIKQSLHEARLEKHKVNTSNIGNTGKQDFEKMGFQV